MNTDSLEILNHKYKQDFNTALNLYENDYSHEDLILLLENGTVVERQVSALKLNSINSQKEADIFVSNLTGCDGKIREAVSFRLQEFVCRKPQFFTKFTDKFLDAVIDINGNICRNTISAIKYLKNDKEFCLDFCRKLTDRTLILSDIVSNFDLQDGKYKVNKEIFKLYWYLETIYEFSEFIPAKTLVEILSKTKSINEYTIREKTAKILTKDFQNDELLKIKKELKQDKNYYVRRF